MSLYVKLLLLFGVEGRGDERQGCLVADVPGDVEHSEIGAENVFLLSVEIDLETLDVLKRTEMRLTVFGNEVVVVF